MLALSLAACGKDTTTASDGEGTTAPATEPQDTTTQEDTNAGTASVSTGRTLVVYFSATGTPRWREYIADLTGGDLFQLEPADPYTDEDLNWTDEKRPGGAGARQPRCPRRGLGGRHRGQLGRVRHRVSWLPHLVGHRRLAGGHLRGSQ